MVNSGTLKSYASILANDTSNGIWTFYIGKSKEQTKEDFIPKKIIYNGKYTVCYFRDGSKTSSHPSKDEEYSKDMGVMACIMKKLFESRGEFLRLVESGYEQPMKEK